MKQSLQIQCVCKRKKKKNFFFGDIKIRTELFYNFRRVFLKKKNV